MTFNFNITMKTTYLLPVLACMTIASAAAEVTDSIPSRSVIVGDASHPDHQGNIAGILSRQNSAFEDPAAPRFLFLDKKGSVALGIGGNLKAIGMYDLDGAVNNNKFITADIPVPFNPAQRSRFGATAAYSSIFLKLVTRPTRVGRVTVYLQTQFSGDNGGYGLVLKQAYVTVGHVTLGKARSTFADGPAMAPTVDEQGPSGQVSSKNIMVQYAGALGHGFSFAASVEVPPTSDYTLAESTEAISQRYPDIPAYVQYAWGGGKSHLRLSGLYRALSYRDMTGSGSNKTVSGWGVQLSTVASLGAGFGIFGHYTYGRGIAAYVNDLADLNCNLIPEGDGKLKAPRMAGLTGGMQYQSGKMLFSASYSRAQLCDTAGMEPDTYRYGQYIAANAFYNIMPELRLGLEYIHGTRKDISGVSGHANRIEAALQYDF